MKKSVIMGEAVACGQCHGTDQILSSHNPLSVEPLMEATFMPISLLAAQRPVRTAI